MRGISSQVLGGTTSGFSGPSRSIDSPNPSAIREPVVCSLSRLISIPNEDYSENIAPLRKMNSPCVDRISRRRVAVWVLCQFQACGALAIVLIPVSTGVVPAIGVGFVHRIHDHTDHFALLEFLSCLL